MKRITERQYQTCKEHGLLFDGRTVYKGLDKRIQRLGFKTFQRTRHNVYVSDGSNGIYDSLVYFERKDNNNGNKK